jgi:hypothetical protein
MKGNRIVGGAGVQLQVMETGNPQGCPIVFLHGASQCWLQWSRQMNSNLAEDGFAAELIQGLLAKVAPQNTLPLG